jgi:hypothetical protein
MTTRRGSITSRRSRVNQPLKPVSERGGLSWVLAQPRPAGNKAEKSARVARVANDHLVSRLHRQASEAIAARGSVIGTTAPSSG